jgi:prevent-host-death family protein
MVAATVRDIRLHLSKFLKLVERGELVVIRNRNTPVARIVPYQAPPTARFPDLTAFRERLRKTIDRKGRPVEQLIRDDREGRG